MHSLQQTCVVLTEHFLEPSHIILVGGGLMLHHELTEPLFEIIPAMDLLLHHATRYHSLPCAPFIGRSELHVLTGTTALHPCATQSQILLTWVTLIDCIQTAMRKLKGLCLGNPFDPRRRNWPSRIPEAIMMLPCSLCIKLPKEFVNSFGMSILLLRCTRKVDVAHIQPDAVTCKPTIRAHPCALIVEATALTCSKIVSIVDEESHPTMVPTAMPADHPPVMMNRMHEHNVPSLTKDILWPPSRNDHPLRSTTSSSASAGGRSCSPSVKALVAAFETRERIPAQWEYPTVTGSAIDLHIVSLQDHREDVRDGPDIPYLKASLLSSPSSPAPSPLLGDSITVEPMEACSNHARASPLADALGGPRRSELGVGVLDSITIVSLRTDWNAPTDQTTATPQMKVLTLEIPTSPSHGGHLASFQSSTPADLVANTTAVELRVLDEGDGVLAESRSRLQERKPLTAWNSEKDNGSYICSTKVKASTSQLRVMES
ncbi:hypothetical protein B0H17DRAFT_1154255 [Mycena rosella]|uniref:Uncharacterized protein n=1 Tax=Mycena rosella TaxID=1033263 RepID=A0AAD7AZE3_MYCRO|nr:hypothetical protein B0H17DRAFT_1154255 [Mycena rosella]